MSRECPRGHWPRYRHRWWEKRWFDKFGTGKRDMCYRVCVLCRAVKES